MVEFQKYGDRWFIDEREMPVAAQEFRPNRDASVPPIGSLFDLFGVSRWRVTTIEEYVATDPSLRLWYDGQAGLAGWTDGEREFSTSIDIGGGHIFHIDPPAVAVWVCDLNQDHESEA